MSVHNTQLRQLQSSEAKVMYSLWKHLTAEHEEKMMRELKEEAEKLREENEDLRV